MNKLIAAGLLATLSSPASAASLAPGVAEPMVAAPVAAPAGLGGDWAGAYSGVSLGYGDLSLEADLEELVEDFLPELDVDELPSLSLSDGGVSYGAHLGYNWQNGRTVFGVEVAVLGSQAELEVAGEGMSIGAELDYAARLMGKVGYQFAEALFYGTAGVAYAEFGTTGDISGDSEDETGYAYGIGMDYRLTETVSIGAEHVRHRFNDVAGFDGVDGEFATTSLRVSYHF